MIRRPLLSSSSSSSWWETYFPLLLLLLMCRCRSWCHAPAQRPANNTNVFVTSLFPQLEDETFATSSFATATQFFFLPSSPPSLFLGDTRFLLVTHGTGLTLSFPPPRSLSTQRLNRHHFFFFFFFFFQRPPPPPPPPSASPPQPPLCGTTRALLARPSLPLLPPPFLLLESRRLRLKVSLRSRKREEEGEGEGGVMTTEAAVRMLLCFFCPSPPFFSSFSLVRLQLPTEEEGVALRSTSSTPLPSPPSTPHRSTDCPFSCLLLLLLSATGTSTDPSVDTRRGTSPVLRCFTSSSCRE